MSNHLAETVGCLALAAALCHCGSASKSGSEDTPDGAVGPDATSADSPDGSQAMGSDAGERDSSAADGSKGDGAPSSSKPTMTVNVRCATAAVVGLSWNAISGASYYGIMRGGKALGVSATAGFSDGTVAAKTAYTYAVTAYDSGGSSIVADTAQTTTAASSANGDAPYCPSQIVKTFTWNWSTAYNQQNGSDLWPSTWGADNNVYFFFGDGGGFGGSNTAGRASFGISRVTGGVAAITASDAENYYGGLNAAHPSTLDGKAGAIMAIGSNFYALGGIYRSGEGGPSGSPNHYEIIESVGNAYSWTDTAWTFCAADSSGHVTQGVYCAASFVNFGPGNAGAMDDYVYMAAAPAAGWFSSAPSSGPANTYMMRVLNNQLTTQDAYTYYAGVDAKGSPVWSSSTSDAQPIFTDRNAKPMGIGGIVYNAALKRFVGSAQGAVVAEAAFYESEYPWGPWNTISYDNTNADGSGGFGDLGSSDYISGHGDSLGVNFINGWTSSDGLTMWATLSSDGDAPSTALVPGLAGNDMDSFSLVSVTLGL